MKQYYTENNLSGVVEQFAIQLGTNVGVADFGMENSSYIAMSMVLVGLIQYIAERDK